MFRALLPLLLICGISSAAPPLNPGVTPPNETARSPQLPPAPGSTAPAQEATSTTTASPAVPAAPVTPAKPVKQVKSDPAQEGLKSDSYRALLSLIVMGTIALRHARYGSP